MKVITNSTLCTLTKQHKSPPERKESFCLTYLIPTVCADPIIPILFETVENGN